MGLLMDSEDCQRYREVLRSAKALANAVNRLHAKLRGADALLLRRFDKRMSEPRILKGANPWGSV